MSDRILRAELNGLLPRRTAARAIRGLGRKTALENVLKNVDILKEINSGP